MRAGTPYALRAKGQGFLYVLLITVSPALSTVLNCCSVDRSCPILCNPMGCSMPGFPVLCYLLEFAETHVHWIGDAFSMNQQVLAIWSLVPLLGAHVHSLSCVRLFVTPWTVAHQSSLSMGFPRQEILEWVTISFSRGIFLIQASNLCFLYWQVILYQWVTWEASSTWYCQWRKKKKSVAWSFQ